MKNKVLSADHSFYYHEKTFAEVARMDSATLYGNLADAMKNATIPLSPPQIIETKIVSSPIEDGNKASDDTPHPHS